MTTTSVAMCKTCGSTCISLSKRHDPNGAVLGYFFHCRKCNHDTIVMMQPTNIEMLVDWSPIGAEIFLAA